MALSAFDDKSRKPGKKELTEVLGRSYSHWVTLQEHVCSEFAPVINSPPCHDV